MTRDNANSSVSWELKGVSDRVIGTEMFLSTDLESSFNQSRIALSGVEGLRGGAVKWSPVITKTKRGVVPVAAVRRRSGRRRIAICAVAV